MAIVAPFGLAGFRSFGPDIQYVETAERLNIFPGPNNSGKSNVVAFLKDHYNTVTARLRPQRRSASIGFDGLDAHISREPILPAYAFGATVASLREKLEAVPGLPQDFGPGRRDVLNRVLFHPIWRRGDYLWFRYRVLASGQSPVAVDVEPLANHGSVEANEWRRLAHLLGGQSQGGNPAVWAGTVFDFLRPTPDPVEIEVIPAIRNVGPPGSEVDGFGGAGLIDRLHQLQNPRLDEPQNEARFAAINRFVGELLNDQDARLRVPHDKQSILVRSEGRELPLERLGTGVSEVIILAAAASVLTNHVICIEEPELHLHPLLQRKLARYLVESTDNQYFVTTHSAHLLDLSLGRIHRVSHVDGSTRIDSVRDATGQFQVCRDLGYQASDLLQANCVVWVEGPSDRLYIRHWIAQIRPDLIEGIHFSIMFYGGRLLAHLGANDPEVSEFISLVAINRNLAVVIDSDRGNRGKRLGATKQRVAREIEGTGGLSWVTAGREIENYLPLDELEKVVATHFPRGQLPRVRNRYARLLGDQRLDKVKVASKLTAQPLDMGALDLVRQVRRLVGFIDRANGLTS